MQGKLNKQMANQLREQLPFAKSIYKSIVEEWLIATINVDKARKAIRENHSMNKERTVTYTFKPKEIMKMTYEKYQTHTLAFPSIGIYLFPQTDKPFHSLFKSTEQLFKTGQLMVSIKSNSPLLDKMTDVFAEHGYRLSSTVGEKGELKIEIQPRGGEF